MVMITPPSGGILLFPENSLASLYFATCHGTGFNREYTFNLIIQSPLMFLSETILEARGGEDNSWPSKD